MSAVKASKAITIDQLNLKDHVRWAEDQKQFDVSFVKESQIVAPHPEIVGMSAIYPSKFDALFELYRRNTSWAAFEPPKNFHQFGKRFFSHRLFPHFNWEEELRDSSDEELKNLRQTIASLKRLPHQTPALFEKEKAALFSLLESINWINSQLVQINGRKLQYQKG